MMIQKVLQNSNQLLTDKHNRVMKKLRVSLMDACNFKCLYCMPEEFVSSSSNDWLSPNEINDICSNLVDLGLNEIRLTGGEPTLRKELPSILKMLGKLKLEKFGITTNGFLVHKYFDDLLAANCRYLNISLDSLEESKFNKLTNTNSFHKVMDNIMKANDLGFHLKINAVLMKGYSFDELESFVGFSEATGIPVRFIELLRIGPQQEMLRKHYVSSAEARSKIEKMGLTEIIVPKDSTSRVYHTKEGGEIGFISSESEPFCHSCSRLRLTANGFLRACLFSEDGLNLRSSKKENYTEILSKVILMKPTNRIESIDQAMVSIGG